MFKSKVKLLAVMACCSVLLLCSTLVFALGTQNFGGNVNIQYTAPKESKFLTYELNSSNDGWVVTGYDESLRNGETELNIPAMHEENGQNLPVTEIAAGAFNREKVFTNLTLGGNVFIIGPDAFLNCSGLTSINVSGENEYYTSSDLKGNECNMISTKQDVSYIDPYDGYISINKGTLIQGCNYSTIPDDGSVTNIGRWAFAFCREIKSLTIPIGLDGIGEYAFYDCSGLTGELVIPESVKIIGFYAFSECRGLTKLTLSNGLESIGYGAFYNCSGLQGDLIIPNGITLIDSDLFNGCSGLTSVVLPNTLENIGMSAFAYCSGLTKIVIPSSVKYIIGYTFVGCNELTDVTIDSQTVCKNLIGWEKNDENKPCLIDNATTIRAKYEIAGLTGYTRSSTQDSNGYWVYTKQ